MATFYDTTRRNARGCIQGTVVGMAWTGVDIGIWRLGIFTGGRPYLGFLTGELYLYEKDDWTLVLPFRRDTSCSFLGAAQDGAFKINHIVSL